MRYDGRGALILLGHLPPLCAACGRHSMRYDGRGALILLGHPPPRVTVRGGNCAGVVRMRPAYDRLATLDEVLRRAGELSARTLVFDVEPLVAYWDSGQEALDRGVEAVLTRARAVPGVEVVCFATNSLRRPTVLLAADGVRVVYVAHAGKPVRTGYYQGFPRPGVVIGDQMATDGALARRLGYAFLEYHPDQRSLPAGPRLMDWCGQLVRPLLFARPH